MRDLDDENTPLRPQFDLLLSEGVGPFLGSMGFTQHGTKFVRYRGPIYDVIGFQNDWHNDVPWHGFFVNVGVGSREVDEVWPGPCPQPPIGFLFDRRWESVVPDLPYEPRFDRDTNMKEFAAALRRPRNGGRRHRRIRLHGNARGVCDDEQPPHRLREDVLLSRRRRGRRGTGRLRRCT